MSHEWWHPVLVQAFIGTASAFRPITMPSSDSTIADLRMPAEGDTGVAIVAGHVISETGTPVVGGTVEILGGKMEAPTGDDGAYGLRGPEGSQVLVVRRIGLGAAVVPVELYARRPRLVNMTMLPALSTLPVVTVVADRLRLAQVYNAIGLTARARDGHGHRLTVDQIDAKQAQNAAQLLEGVPGVVLRVNHNNELRAYPTRSTETLNSYGDCTAYVVDGALIGNGHVVYTIDQNGVPQGNEDESVLPRPADLIAVEVYQPNEPSPLADGGVLKCLKVFYWTKAMMGKP